MLCSVRICYHMREHDKAKRWRTRRGLTIAQLAEMTGYGVRACNWMERGLSPPNATRSKPAAVAPWVWQRYKRACAGVEAQLQSGKPFNWGG